jgi:hypothetical protein
MPVRRDHMRLEWVTSYRILQPSNAAVFMLTALRAYVRTSAQAALALQIMPQLRTADRKHARKTKFRHDYLRLHSVSVEFNYLQTSVRTFHLSAGQTELHECRKWRLVLEKTSIGPWNTKRLEKRTLKCAANIFITPWIYKTCSKRDPPCSMCNSTLRYPCTNEWR